MVGAVELVGPLALGVGVALVMFAWVSRLLKRTSPQPLGDGNAMAVPSDPGERGDAPELPRESFQWLTGHVHWERVPRGIVVLYKNGEVVAHAHFAGRSNTVVDCWAHSVLSGLVTPCACTTWKGGRRDG